MARATVAMHERARDESIAAYVAVFGHAPYMCERQYLQAISLFETTYGYGWKEAGAGSNNMGAIKVPGEAPCPPGSFPSQDEGLHCFRIYPTRHDGWVGLVRNLYVRLGRSDMAAVRSAAISCDIDGAVDAQKAAGYFTADVENYRRAVWDSINEIAAALGEPLPPKAG